MFYFFYPPCTSRENWVRTTTSFKLAIEISQSANRSRFLNPQNPNFWSFWQTRFLAKSKVHRRRDILHADILTDCPLDANIIIKFRAYRRLICCYPPRMSRETWVGISMAFWSSMKISLSYVPGMHVVVFTRSSSVARALASTPICCSILQYTKRAKPSTDTWAIAPWVRVVPSLLCASLFQSVCVRVGDDVFLVTTWNLLVIVFTRYRMPLLGPFSCRPSVSPKPSAARMPLLILWLSPTGYCYRERQNSLFVLEYTSSRVWFL